MTGRERLHSALRGTQPDRVPVFLRDLTLGMDVTGMTTPEVCSGGPRGGYDGAKSARCVIECQRRFGHDCVVGSIQDLGMDAEALGGRVDFPKTGVPRIVKHPFADKRTFAKAMVPRMDTDGRLPGILDAYQRVRKELGKTVAVAANVEGPVTKAGLLRGFEDLMIDTVEDNDFVHDLVAFATDVSISHAQCMVEAGADVVFVAAAGDGPAMISPTMMRDLTIAHLARMVQAAHGWGVPVIFHPHGRFTDPAYQPLVQAALETGIDGFQFPEHCDVKTAIQQWGRSITILAGTDISTVLAPGPEESIRQDVRAQLQAATGHAPFIFMPSCSIHRGIPLNHVGAMINAVRTFGKY